MSADNAKHYNETQQSTGEQAAASEANSDDVVDATYEEVNDK